MKFLYFDTWKHTSKPLLFPGTGIIAVTNACVPGEEGLKTRPSKVLGLRELLRGDRRLIKRAWRYSRAIGIKRTRAKVRSNLLAYEVTRFNTKAAVAGVLMAKDDQDLPAIGSVVAGYRLDHPFYAERMALHHDQMVAIPEGISLQDAATVFYYTIALETFHRVENEHSSDQRISIYGTNFICRLLGRFFEDANKEYRFIGNLDLRGGLSSKEAAKENGVRIIGSFSAVALLHNELKRNHTFWVGLPCENINLKEWTEFRERWIGLPHPLSHNLNIFSRLPLDIPKYLTKEGLQSALLDMKNRKWAPSELLTPYDVCKAKVGEKISLSIAYSLQCRNSEDDAKSVVQKNLRYRGDIGCLRVGFIGLGMWARGNLIPFLLRDNRVRLTMGADQDPVRLQQAGDLFNIPMISSDPHEVISSDQIDAVFISTWHDSHAELAAQAIRAGKKVFVEKPLALDYEQLRMVVSAVEEVPNSFLAVGYNRVHSDVTRLLERQLTNHDGPITLTAIVREPTIPSTHYYYWPHQGPRIVSNGCHWIDYAFHLLLPRIPSDIRVIPAFGRDDESNNTIVMRYSDGSLVTLIFSDRGESLIGGNEYIDIKCDGTQFEIRDFKSCTRYQEGKVEEIWRSKADRGWEQEMRDVVEGMISGRSPRSYEEIVISALLSLEAKCSYENKGEVRRISVGPIENIRDANPLDAAGLVRCSSNR